MDLFPSLIICMSLWKILKGSRDDSRCDIWMWILIWSYRSVQTDEALVPLPVKQAIMRLKNRNKSIIVMKTDCIIKRLKRIVNGIQILYFRKSTSTTG